MNDYNKEAPENYQKQLIEYLCTNKQSLSDRYKEAVNYTRIIIVIAYLGFFQVWSNSKDELSPRVVLLSSFFIGISLAAFVFFEVYKMHKEYREISKEADLLDKPAEEYTELKRAQQEKINDIKRGLIKYELHFFWITLIPGVLAVITLLIGVFSSLVNNISC